MLKIGLVGVLLALIPFPTQMVPALSILVVDETGRFVPGATVVQHWRNYSVELSGGHEEHAVSDDSGVVHFPPLRVWACAAVRVLGPVWNVLTYLQHARLGPHSQIIARYQQKQGDVVYRPGYQPVRRDTMIHFRTLLCSVVLLGSCCGCSTGPRQGNRAEDEQMIRDIEGELSRALSARDLGHLVSFYADDAALYYADKPMVAGKDAIWETWNATTSRPGFSMSIESMGVQVPSNLAFSHGVYRTTTKDTLGRTVTNEGEYAVVYAKQADGKWRIVADNGDSALGAHSLPKDKPKRTSLLMDAFAVMALTFSLFFLFVVPILFLLFVLDFRSEGWSTSFLVSAVMLTAFAVTAALLWKYVATHYWNLSFLTALAAAGDAARYGHPVEHTAENVLGNLLVFSTLSAVVTGTITALVRYLWFRRPSLAAR